MKTTVTACVLALAALMAGAPAGAEPLSGTRGPYPVVMEHDPAHPEHTVFRPADPSEVRGAMPIVAFGNGGCFNAGNAFQTFLGEVASHGYLVTAPGKIEDLSAGMGPAPGNARPAQSKPGQMLRGVEWSLAQAQAGPLKGKVDADRIAVMGQSCGGLEAIAAGADPRVDTVVVLNSGIIRGGIPNPDGSIRQPAGQLPANESDLAKLHTPIAYFVGGPKDQAHGAAGQDFDQIDGLPLFNANIDVGHGGTWREPGGGAMGAAAIAWLDWQLKGDAVAGRQFTGPDCGLCKDAAWTVKKKNLP